MKQSLPFTLALLFVIFATKPSEAFVPPHPISGIRSPLNQAQPTSFTSMQSSSVPSISEQVGKFVPFVPQLPNGSVDQAISSNPGDLVLIAILVLLPRILHEIRGTIRVLPAKYRSYTEHIERVGRMGVVLYAINVLDAVVALVFHRLSMARNIKSILFGILWWLPSRFAIAQSLRDALQWLSGGINERQVATRAIAAAVYYACFVAVQEGLGTSLSQAIQILLPFFLVLQVNFQQLRN